jgi:hypothetical protein
VVSGGCASAGCVGSDLNLSESASVVRIQISFARNIRPGNEPLPQEVDIAHVLVNRLGIKVLLRGSNVPGGDALINLGQERRLRAEFKTLESPMPRAFENNLREASRQTGHFPGAVVIDARGVSVPLTEASAAIDRAMRNVASRRPYLQEVFVITNEGIIQRSLGR